MLFSMYSGFFALVRKYGIEQAAKTAAALGFSSVELFDKAGKESFSPTFPNVQAAARAREVLHQHGLSVSCYSVATTLVAPDSTLQKNAKAIDELKAYADMTAALGAPYLHHTLVLKMPLPTDAPRFDEILEPVAEAAAEVAHYCEGLGLTCLYEDQGMYFNGVEKFGRFFAKMQKRCPNVGVCGDMGNTLFVDESPVPFFRAFAPHIKHVHVKDYRMIVDQQSNTASLCSKGGTLLKDTVIGQGEIDIPGCLQILREHNYKGAFALEDPFCENYADSARAAFSLVEKHF